MHNATVKKLLTNVDIFCICQYMYKVRSLFSPFLYPPPLYSTPHLIPIHVLFENNGYLLL